MRTACASGWAQLVRISVRTGQGSRRVVGVLEIRHRLQKSASVALLAGS
jgi:hypothetical protein